MRRGEIWIADLPAPAGSEAAYRRPVIVVQHDAANDSRLNSVIVVPLTSSLASHAGKRWTVTLTASATGLPRDSVGLLYLVTAIDRSQLQARVAKVGDDVMQDIDLGLLRVLALDA